MTSVSLDYKLRAARHYLVTSNNFNVASDGVTIGGNATITGDATISGNATIGGNAAISGNVTIGVTNADRAIDVKIGAVGGDGSFAINAYNATAADDQPILLVNTSQVFVYNELNAFSAVNLGGEGNIKIDLGLLGGTINDFQIVYNIDGVGTATVATFATNAINVNGSVSANGTGTFNDLNITGIATFGGNVSIDIGSGDNFIIKDGVNTYVSVTNGAVDITNPVNINGDATVTGDLKVNIESNNAFSVYSDSDIYFTVGTESVAINHPVNITGDFTVSVGGSDVFSVTSNDTAVFIVDNVGITANKQINGNSGLLAVGNLTANVTGGGEFLVRNGDAIELLNVDASGATFTIPDRDNLINFTYYQSSGAGSNGSIAAFSYNTATFYVPVHFGTIEADTIIGVVEENRGDNIFDQKFVASAGGVIPVQSNETAYVHYLQVGAGAINAAGRALIPAGSLGANVGIIEGNLFIGHTASGEAGNNNTGAAFGLYQIEVPFYDDGSDPSKIFAAGSNNTQATLAINFRVVRDLEGFALEEGSIVLENQTDGLVLGIRQQVTAGHSMNAFFEFRAIGLRDAP